MLTVLAASAHNYTQLGFGLGSGMIVKPQICIRDVEISFNKREQEFILPFFTGIKLFSSLISLLPLFLLTGHLTNVKFSVLMLEINLYWLYLNVWSFHRNPYFQMPS